MRITLRYFYNPKTGGLVTSVGSLAFALKNKCEVKHIVHWHSTVGQYNALMDAVDLLKSRLLAVLWKYYLTVVAAFFAAVVLWWLPLGLQIKWGWPAFLVLMGLPLSVAIVSLGNATRVLALCWRLPDFGEWIAEDMPRLAIPMACPTMLLAEQDTVAAKQWPAIVSTILLLAFMGTVGRMTIPLRGWVPIVHDLGGNTFVAEEIRWLKPGEHWEYAPRFIRGTAYGMLYYEEDMEKVLVLSVDYTLENTKHRPAPIVRRQMQTWVSNIAYYYSMTIKSGASVDLSREEMTNEVREGIESEPVQAALHKTVKEVADGNLEERFTTLSFEVKWVSIDDYISKVR